MTKQRYLCAVCRSKLPPLPDRHIGFSMHLKLLMTTAFFVMCVGLTMGGWAAVKASIFHLPLVLIAEWFQWLKIRSALRCKTCDFDPMLYRSNWRMARKQVERKLRNHSDELQRQIREEIARLHEQKTGKTLANSDGANRETIPVSVDAPATQVPPEELPLTTNNSPYQSPYQKANKPELSS